MSVFQDSLTCWSIFQLSTTAYQIRVNMEDAVSTELAVTRVDADEDTLE